MLLKAFTYFWLLLTLALLLKPGLGFENHVLFSNEDKVVHFSLFLTLSLLWFRYFYIDFGFSINKTVLLIACFGFFLSGITEVLQKYIPGRGTDFIDFIFNILGVSFAMLFYVISKKRNKSLAK